MTIYVAIIENRQGAAMLGATMLTCHTKREKAHEAIKEYFSQMTGELKENTWMNDYEFEYMGDTWTGNVYARVLMGAE